MDPSEVYSLSGEMTQEFFVLQAKAIGITTPAQLKEPAVQDYIVLQWLVYQRATRFERLCIQLGIAATQDQIVNIAKSSLVSHDRFPKGIPLSPQERAIAVELNYHALRDFARKQGDSTSEADLRADALNMVKSGEQGVTVLHKVGKFFGFG
ncbi:MAG TPA: hypothetical protein VMP01_18485 [Pirellulaceae bacterium]|nr:hypothetical protein [Pirellulaceae bacterium]